MLKIALPHVRRKAVKRKGIPDEERILETIAMELALKDLRLEDISRLRRKQSSALARFTNAQNRCKREIKRQMAENPLFASVVILLVEEMSFDEEKFNRRWDKIFADAEKKLLAERVNDRTKVN